MKSKFIQIFLVGTFIVFFFPLSSRAQFTINPQALRTPIHTNLQICLQANPNAVTQIVSAVCNRLSSIYALPSISFPIGPDLSCAGSFDAHGGNKIWDNLGINGGFANLFSTDQIRELVGTCKVRVNADVLHQCLTEISSWNWSQVTSQGVSPTNLSNLENLLGSSCNGLLSAPDPSQVGCQEYTVHCLPPVLASEHEVPQPPVCYSFTELSRILPTQLFPACGPGPGGHIAGWNCTSGCVHPMPPLGAKTNCKIAKINCSCTGEAPFQTDYRMREDLAGIRSYPIDPPPCMSQWYINNDLSSGTDDCNNPSLPAGATCTVTDWGCETGMECSTPEY